MFELAQNEGVEKFAAVKPWIGALKAPTNAHKINPEIPNIKLQLEYVNGFKSEDVKQTVHYGSTDDEIVYPAGAIIVKLNLRNNEQQFFGAREAKDVNGHNDDIECIDVNPDRTLVATGQRGSNPGVIVWDLKSRGVKGKFFLSKNGRSCRNIKFSKCGKYLFAVDLSNDRNVHAFSVNNLQKIDLKKSGVDVVVDFDTSPVGGSFLGAIMGKKVVQFLGFDGTTIQLKRGILGSVAAANNYLCLSYVPSQKDRLVTGDAKGNLILWEGAQAQKCVNIEQGQIYSVFCNDSSLFASGWKSKSIHQLELQSFLQGQSTIKKTHNINSVAQSLSTSSNSQQILVGTTNGQIITLSEGQSPKVWIDSHFSGETWGLDLDQSQNIVISTGDDNKIVAFDTTKNQTVSTSIVNAKPGIKKTIEGASTLSIFPPNQQSRAVSVNPKNGHVAIATNSAQVSVRQGSRNLDKYVLENKTVGNEWIEVLRYSPDGKYLAVGSHDNHVYILNVENNYAQSAVCKANNSFITSVDWTQDSSKIRTNSGSYELLFFQASTGAQITDGATSTRDELWATNTSRITWENQGIYLPGKDGSHINGVAKSSSGKYTATGDDDGLVNLLNVPNDKSSKQISYRAHSSHVVRVQFDASDKYLYSVGGYDKLLLKWKIVK